MTPASSTMSARLREHGITPTLQRLQVAEVMLSAPVHLTADQVLARARALTPEISRATVYSSLSLLAERGLIRTLVIEGEALVFDSTLEPHYHLFDVDSRTLHDLSPAELKLSTPPGLERDYELLGIDVVVKARRRSA